MINKQVIGSICKRQIIIVALLCLVIVISGWAYITNGIETGPYQFTYPANFGNRINIPENNPTTKQGVYLGRMLFYEKKLSANNSISCANCHQQNKAFTDGKAFSEGVDHVPTVRNSMSLANLLWARKFFWDGRAASLEEQSVVPMTDPHEMGQSLDLSSKKLSNTVTYPELFKLVYDDKNITGERICKAIAQFELTLISCNSKYDKYREVLAIHSNRAVRHNRIVPDHLFQYGLGVVGKNPLGGKGD